MNAFDDYYRHIICELEDTLRKRRRQPCVGADILSEIMPFIEDLSLLARAESLMSRIDEQVD